MTQQKKTNNIELEQRNEFCKIIKEFIPDLLHTFPEYKDNLDNGILDILNDEYDSENVDTLLEYCCKVYPESFFDIIYQNEDLFRDVNINEKMNDKNTQFLPKIDFKDIWKQDISENTKNIIWKYLQLILLTILTSVKDKSHFGDTAKLFEAIDENEFKNKLEETISNMEEIFDFSNNPNNNIDGSNINLDKLPDPEDIHNHINGMLNGKLGNLAKEITEETAREMNIDMNNVSSVNDVFKQLFKNPSKLMGMVKNVGNKLESKIKSGDIKESELIQEATDMMSHMKDMPGMNNIQSLINNLGLPTGFGGGKNSKVNLGAMQSHMKQSLQQTKQRERMLEKLRQRQQEKERNQNNQSYITGQEQEVRGGQQQQQEYKFTKGEKPEKSKRKQKNKKNKKKNKK